MKTKTMLLAILLGMSSIAFGQGYLGIGTGMSAHAWTMNLETGFRNKYSVFEFEVKAAPISQSVNEPGVFSLKAGYPIAFKKTDLLVIPMAEYAYMLYSQDVSKTVTYQNGWKMGAGLRLQVYHLFVQADYVGRPYLQAGIIAIFRNRQ